MPKLITVIMTSGLLIAACSSSNGSSAAQTGPRVEKSLVRYAECMRSQGVPTFPDPGTTQGPNAFGMDGYTFNLPANLNVESPGYKDADKACGHLVPGASGGGHGISAKAKQAALAHATCMRQHGVPNYPDPTFSGNGMSQRAGGPSLNAQSPAFQYAQKACQPH